MPRLAFTALVPLLAWLSPARAVAAEDPKAPVPTSDPRQLHAIGLHAHGLFIPESLLKIGLQIGEGLNSGGLGLHYTLRRSTLDIVTTVNFSFISPPSGNFLGVGKDASIDTHYTQFRGLNMLSFDISLYWVKDLGNRVAFIIGGGFGLAALLGDVLVVNNSGAGCTTTTAKDVDLCHPNVEPGFYTRVGNPVPTWTDSSGSTQPLSGPLLPSDPDFNRKLDGLMESQRLCKAMNGGDCRDTADHPYAHKAPEKPPVAVIINLQLGFRLKIHRHVNVNLMGGFRDGFVIGGGPEYVF